MQKSKKKKQAIPKSVSFGVICVGILVAVYFNMGTENSYPTARTTQKINNKVINQYIPAPISIDAPILLTETNIEKLSFFNSEYLIKKMELISAEQDAKIEEANLKIAIAKQKESNLFNQGNNDFGIINNIPEEKISTFVTRPIKEKKRKITLIAISLVDNKYEALISINGEITALNKFGMIEKNPNVNILVDSLTKNELCVNIDNIHKCFGV